MNGPPPAKAPREYEQLVAAMDEYRPRCRDDKRFTADVLSPQETAHMRRVCSGCPIRSACDEYARAAQLPVGFWAGQTYPLPKVQTAVA